MDETALSDWRDSWQRLVLENRLDEAIALCAQARADAEESGDLALAIEADHARSEVITLLPGPKAEALTLAVDSAVEARAFGFVAVEARARIAEGHALAAVGSVHAGLDTLLQAKNTLRALGDERGLAWADLRVSRALLAAGEHESSELTAARFQRWAFEHGDEMLAAAGTAAIAEALIAQGRVEEARQHASMALELARAGGFRLIEYQAEVVLGDCSAADSKWDDALTHYETAWTLRPEFPEVQWRLGRLHAASGRVIEATSLLNACVESTVAEGNVELESRARFALASLARSQGDEQEAARQQALAEKAEDGYRAVAFDESMARQLAAFEASRAQRAARSEADRRH